MEAGNKQSASSFTNNLFGAKDSSPSSHILTSIFAPPPHQVRGAGENEKSSGSVTQASTAKTPLLGDEEKKIWSKGKSSSRFPEQKMEPFHYSSSIYYGGQDVYSQPHTAPNTTNTNTYNKDGGEEEDDSGSASRGNWWQGSLYY